MRKILLSLSAIAMVFAMASCGGSSKSYQKDIDNVMTKMCSCGDISDDTDADAQYDCLMEAFSMIEGMDEKYGDNEEAISYFEKALDECECPETLQTLYLIMALNSMGEEGEDIDLDDALEAVAAEE